MFNDRCRCTATDDDLETLGFVLRHTETVAGTTVVRRGVDRDAAVSTARLQGHFAPCNSGRDGCNANPATFAARTGPSCTVDEEMLAFLRSTMRPRTTEAK